ncbi:MAG: TolC family protein [Bacteroidaceae bacterium]|nr:TolC family protein [Bacteroidaceae bacterium]
MKKILYIIAIVCTAIPVFSQVTTPLPVRDGPGVGLVSLTLSDCRRQALAHNESLQKADLAVRQSELDRQMAFASYLPKLDGSVTAIFRKDTRLLDDLELQMRGTYLAGLNLTQPIFAGGKIVTANKLAKVGEEVAQLQRAKTEQQVIADADRAYFTLVAVRQKVTMLEALHRQMEGLWRQVSTSVEANLATRNDLLRIETKLSEIDYQLQKARNGAEICRLSLCNVMGTDLTIAYQPTDTLLADGSVEYSANGSAVANSSLFTLHSSLQEVDISDRPEVALLAQSVRASELQVRMQRANLLPTLGLSIGYSHYDNLKLRGQLTSPADGTIIPANYTISGNSPMALLSMSIPIWHWGADLKKVKRARLDVESTRLDQQQTTRLLTIEAQNAAQNLSDSQRMLQTAIVGQQQADENLRVMHLRYDESLATLTDLLDAQSQWQQAHSNLIEAHTQLRINETEYLRTTGHLTP